MSMTSRTQNDCDLKIFKTDLSRPTDVRASHVSVKQKFMLQLRVQMFSQIRCTLHEHLKVVFFAYITQSI